MLSDLGTHHAERNPADAAAQHNCLLRLRRCPYQHYQNNTYAEKSLHSCSKTTKAPTPIAAGVDLPQGREGFTRLLTAAKRYARYHLASRISSQKRRHSFFGSGSGATFDGVAVKTLAAGGVFSLIQLTHLLFPIKAVIEWSIDDGKRQCQGEF